VYVVTLAAGAQQVSPPERKKLHFGVMRHLPGYSPHDLGKVMAILPSSFPPWGIVGESGWFSATSALGLSVVSPVSVVRPEELLLEGELPGGQAAQEAV